MVLAAITATKRPRQSTVSWGNGSARKRSRVGLWESPGTPEEEVEATPVNETQSQIIVTNSLFDVDTALVKYSLMEEEADAEVDEA